MKELNQKHNIQSFSKKNSQRMGNFENLRGAPFVLVKTDWKVFKIPKIILSEMPHSHLHVFTFIIIL